MPTKPLLSYPTLPVLIGISCLAKPKKDSGLGLNMDALKPSGGITVEKITGHGESAMSKASGQQLAHYRGWRPLWATQDSWKQQLCTARAWLKPNYFQDPGHWCLSRSPSSTIMSLLPKLSMSFIFFKNYHFHIIGLTRKGLRSDLCTSQRQWIPQ